ncbi:SDR family oxidoreductase [Neomegalonema sp.]|uniref:SDR family NAD(P)-dependent oxidoreductase n=1 Tax=Neomegalonema sp. TaxID=2039713 RepID=UPI0026344BC0|nr:SDR family oxidoreductase [Neomegalonema sp.]MDD2869537.1 SDR family oxidoreductase [Neomegalonema sp.]
MSEQPVVFVTGGGRGIGAAVVRLAARRGWAVAFSYLGDSGSAEALAAEVRAEGGRALALQGDVADSGFPAPALDRIEAELGPVTMLVNNAGITGRIGGFLDMPLDVMRRTFEVNVLGLMGLTQEVARRWRAGGIKGRIVNLSSTAATSGAPGDYIHYAASKAAVDAFTLGLAKELGPLGIRVNAVSPTVTRTRIHADGGKPERVEAAAGRIPLGRVGEPEDSAEAVIWLLSEEAGFVSGSILKVSGGG